MIITKVHFSTPLPWGISAVTELALGQPDKTVTLQAIDFDGNGILLTIDAAKGMVEFVPWAKIAKVEVAQWWPGQQTPPEHARAVAAAEAAAAADKVAKEQEKPLVQPVAAMNLPRVGNIPRKR